MSTKRCAVAILTAALTIALTGCYSQADAIRDRSKAMTACTDAGGEWYSTDVRWSEESCHFDSRKGK